MVLSRVFSFSFVDSSGIPLDGGEMWTYLSDGTEVLTYKDPDGESVNTNPIILDSRGCADIYIEYGKKYLFILKDKEGNLVCSFEDVDVSIPDGSVEVRHFSDPLPLVAGDGIKLTPHDVGGTTVLVVELLDDVKRKLETM